MKSYEQYHAEYVDAISEGVRKGDNAIVKECVYISCKWQKENNCDPWDKDFSERIEELKQTDEKLYEAVMDGMIALEAAWKEGLKND
jgi:hypothetical protein